MARFLILHFAVLFIVTMSFDEVNGATTQQVIYNPYATVLLYSGLPNPRWQLSLEEWQKLNQLIQTLPMLVENNISPYQLSGNLGYSGFSAHFAIISSYPDIYFVPSKHQAVLSNPGGHLIFNDEQKLIEKWFIDSAKNHGIPLPIQSFI